MKELLLLLLLAEEDDEEELLDDEDEVPSRLSALCSRVSASSARSGLCIRSCTGKRISVSRSAYEHERYW